MTQLKKNSDLDSLANVAAGDSVNIRDISDTAEDATGKTKRMTQRNLIRWVKGADIASASALSPGSDGNAFDVTGTTTITSINTIGVGTLILLHFDAILTLTHHATNLVIPGGANITTIAGAEAILYEYDTGKWRLVTYNPVTVDMDDPTFTTKITTPKINLTGGQIAFPATAVPSADANTLDDYEEGSFTVDLNGDETWTTGPVGEYIKIGNLVFIDGSFTINVIGTGAADTIHGFPFTVGGSASQQVYIGIASLTNAAVNFVRLSGAARAGFDYFYIRGLAAAGASDGVMGVLGNGAAIKFAGCYNIG